MKQPVGRGKKASDGAARDDRPRVFLSSTWRDLRRHRRIVLDTIRSLDMEPIAMEEFSAEPVSWDIASVEHVRECDVFVGILRFAYGTIPGEHPVSHTELEFDAAGERDIERLMFVVAATVPRTDDDYDAGKDRRKKQELLDAFKARVRDTRNVGPTEFDDDNLVPKIVRALRGWEKRHRKDRVPELVAPIGNRTLPDDPRLERYREFCLARYSELPLAGFATKLRLKIRLEDLYIPLHAIPDTRGQKIFHSGEEAAEDRELQRFERGVPLATAFEFAAKHGHRRGLVILGDPGSGKTTQLKRMLVACLTGEERGAEFALPEETLPVFLPLRDLDPGDLDADFAALLARTFPKLSPLDADFANWLIHERRHLLYLVDGLDEVPGELREKTRDWIQGTLTDDPTSAFAVTSRYAGYTEDVRFDADFLELHLRPLEFEQAAEFVRNWYRLVETAQDADEGPTIAAERSKDLIDRLARPSFRASRVASMTRNPLLLTNVCLVHRDGGSRLPERRARLYRECIEVLLELWRRAVGLPPSIQSEDAQGVLQPLARVLHERGLTRAPAAELLPALTPAVTRLREKVDPTEFLERIRNESGLLTGWGADSYGFLHLGFQEYLTALDIHREIAEAALEQDAPPAVLDKMAARFGDSWWREVILLLLANDRPSVFRPLFERIVKLPAFAEHEDLVFECLEEAAKTDPRPFVTLLESGAESADVDLQARQLVAARVLDRIAPDELVRLEPVLAKSVSREMRERFGVIEVNLERSSIRVEKAGIELVEIPGGEFWMGSADGEGHADERPRHEVRIEPFLLATTPVTNEQYGRFLAATGHREPDLWSNSKFNAPAQPVVGVSWEDAQKFCEWAGLRLPSEAEWEYACRAGTTTQYWSGDEEADLARVGWYRENSGGSTKPVEQKPASPWGLSDVHGNVWEWCEDEWHGTYEKAPTDGSAWLHGVGSRVVRGGSCFSPATSCRSAFRSTFGPDERYDLLGFRPARSSPNDITSSPPRKKPRGRA